MIHKIKRKFLFLVIKILELFKIEIGFSSIVIIFGKKIYKFRKYYGTKKNKQNSINHFKSKIDYINKGNLYLIPKIYYYNNLVIIEERLLPMSVEEFGKIHNELEKDFGFFQDAKSDNYGYDCCGNIKRLDYSIYDKISPTEKYKLSIEEINQNI